MHNDCFVDYLEWESLIWPLSFSNILCQHKIYALPENTIFEIFRDNEYKLKGKISGVTNAENDLEYIEDQGKQAGEIIKGENVTGYDGYRSLSYQIDQLFISRSTFTPVSLPPNAQHSFQSDVFFSYISETHILNPKPFETILEFYLTGKTNFLYPRTTGRSKEIKYIKRRGRIGIEEHPEKILQKLSGSGGDYMQIITEDMDFIIQKIDKKYLPEWAGGIQIEYNSRNKSIPPNGIREGISEIVSFIIGMPLIKIGETWLDKNENVVKKIAQSPSGDNVISKCNSTVQPPIEFDWHSDRLALEKYLIQVIPVYLKLRDSLNLSDVLWKYWTAKELPIGTNLPILASGFERLAEDHINSRGLIKKYGNLEKKEYYRLIKEVKMGLETVLDKFEFKNRILNKLENPFSLGMGEKIRLFSEDLGLNVTKNSKENAALLARNSMTHSSIEINEAAIKKYLNLTHAYTSLFNRALLKIMGFEGKYIDYSTIGYPAKEMSENLG